MEISLVPPFILFCLSKNLNICNFFSLPVPAATLALYVSCSPKEFFFAAINGGKTWKISSFFSSSNVKDFSEYECEELLSLACSGVVRNLLTSFMQMLLLTHAHTYVIASGATWKRKSKRRKRKVSHFNHVHIRLLSIRRNRRLRKGFGVGGWHRRPALNM